MKHAVLIVAGGRGLRMGGDLPKQFIPFRGKPVLMHTLEAFYRWNPSAELLLVLPEDHQDYWRMLCKEIGCEVPHRIVTGGETRFHSVRNGLRSLEEQYELTQELLIAVHDGVRPFVSEEEINACFTEAGKSGAAIPVVPMVDSLRELEGEGSHPVDRSRYVAVQTPQVFQSDILWKAYQQPWSELFTDDASVVETMGTVIRTVPGNSMNIKITTPFDLLVAKALFAQEV